MAKKQVTLHTLARVSGISYKTVQAKFAGPGAPDRSNPVEDLVKWLRQVTKIVKAKVELPDDFQEQLALAKLQREQWGAIREEQAAEKLRLWNLEKRGKMVEIATVVAQGAAVGDVISSEISRIAKELPTAVAGMDPSRVRQRVEDEMDHLLDCIAKALEQLDIEPVKPGEGVFDDE